MMSEQPAAVVTRPSMEKRIVDDDDAVPSNSSSESASTTTTRSTGVVKVGNSFDDSGTPKSEKNSDLVDQAKIIAPNVSHSEDEKRAASASFNVEAAQAGVDSEGQTESQDGERLRVILEEPKPTEDSKAPTNSQAAPDRRSKHAAPPQTQTLPMESASHDYRSKRGQSLGELVDADSDDSDSEGGGPHTSLKARGPPNSPRLQSNATQPKVLSVEDFDTLQRLDVEYDRALEEREVGWNARYNSVRQSAGFSLGFMFLYLVVGTAFFNSQTDWPLNVSLLFSIYTITTVGYGTTDFPHSNGVLVFITFYILVGIATLVIMVAQVYQYIALEATRAQFERDVACIKHRGFENTGGDLESVVDMGHGAGSVAASATFEDNPWAYRSPKEACMDCAVKCYEWFKLFFRYTYVGQVMAVMFPFLGLILLGALVVGPIEGWTFLEAVYFSVVSLTTVGFGDYVPTRSASVWFCIFWLPTSVGFMSLYLGKVAHFYIQLSNHNVNRLERKMRKYIRRVKEAKEKEREAAFGRAMAAAGQAPPTPTDTDGHDATAVPQDSKLRTVMSSIHKTLSNGFATLPTTADSSDAETDKATSGPLFGSSEAAHEDLGEKRRQRILLNSGVPLSEGDADELREQIRPRGETMKTTKDILLAVKKNMRMEKASRPSRTMSDQGPTLFSDLKHDDVDFMSLRSKRSIHLGRKLQKKPSFALRMLVQERMAEIIATEIAGYESRVEIKENTLSVTIDTLKHTADKWMVPRRARKAFRAVAFEALYFVGEHDLIVRGADALYELTPFEFHGLFGPLLAAMGDSDTMEGWLAVTNLLADVDLRRDSTRPKGLMTMSGRSSRNLTASSAPKIADNLSLWDERSVNNRRMTARQVKQLENTKARQVKEAGDMAAKYDYRWSAAGNATLSRR